LRKIAFVWLLLGSALWAQQSTVANIQQQDPATEAGQFKKNCPLKHVVGCAEVLFTGQPLHIAVGSIAPQDGFGAGLAYVGLKNTENWSTSWSGDAIASSNASWRAGAFLTFVDTRLKAPTATFGTTAGTDNGIPPYVEQPVYRLYEQSISLNKVTFFGEGPLSTRAGRSYFGMTEHIVGGTVVHPVYERLNMGIYGEVNGRVVSIRPSPGQSSPSTQLIYSPATAPGLNHQPVFLQLGAGVRISPSAAKGLLHFKDDFAYRPFVDPSGSGYSFQRITVDLYQEIAIRHKNLLVARDANDPNNCAIDVSSDPPRCPTTFSRSLEGHVGFRVFSTLSMTPGSNVVPFYFQPTLGGSDINGDSTLSSYQDYRFRAPNTLLLQESFEHSLGKFPVGFIFRADQGEVALSRGDLGGNPWIHSFATGLTLRAGGLPQVYFLFSFGGKEGTHTAATINTSLLGSALRPSIF
jgi:hypothetical protein